MVGTVRGTAPTLGVECPDTSTDRWVRTPGAQRVFQVRPSALGPEDPGLLRRNGVLSPCPGVDS